MEEKLRIRKYRDKKRIGNYLGWGDGLGWGLGVVVSGYSVSFLDNALKSIVGMGTQL